jgi:hypothetical protein
MKKELVILLATTGFLLACEKRIRPHEGKQPTTSTPIQAALPTGTSNSPQRERKPREILVYGVPECNFKGDAGNMFPEIGKIFRIRVYFQNRLTRKHLYTSWQGPSVTGNLELIKMGDIKKDFFEINEFAILDVLVRANKKQNDVFGINFNTDSEDGQHNKRIGSWRCIFFDSSIAHQDEYPWNEESRPEAAALRRLFGLPVSDHLNKLERQEFAEALIPSGYYRELPLPSWFDEMHKEPEHRKN